MVMAGKVTFACCPLGVCVHSVPIGNYDEKAMKNPHSRGRGLTAMVHANLGWERSRPLVYDFTP
jgi:hypothetical protein